MSDCDRIRLVVLGGVGVGKTSIIKRFISNTYSNKYCRTIEDLYYHMEYNLGRKTMQVDILDTARNNQVPTMRQISIATADAFILVYDVTSSSSIESIKQCFEEIRKQRENFYEIPFVIAGNKLDLTLSIREVLYEDVYNWIVSKLSKVKVLECSAKNNFKINDIFRAIVILSKKTNLDQRRSSAQPQMQSGKKTPISTVDKSVPEGSGIVNSSNLQDTTPRPRSMSLLRRASINTKQCLLRAHSAIEDCTIS